MSTSVGVLLICSLLLALASKTLAFNGNASYCISCFNCREPYRNNTDQSELCQSGSSTCMKTTMRYPGGAFINKYCIPNSACHEASLGIFGLGFWINCCGTDNCNSAPAMSQLSASLKFTSILVSLLLTMNRFMHF